MKSRYAFAFALLLLGAGCQSQPNKESSPQVSEAAVTQPAPQVIPPTPEPAPKPPEMRGGKIVLTPETNHSYGLPEDVCAAEVFSKGPATKTYTYKHVNPDFTIKLPWNPNWGNNTYAIDPVDATTVGNADAATEIGFGPMTVVTGGGGCAWVRAYGLSIAAASDATTKADELQKNEAEIDLGPDAAVFGKLNLKKFRIGPYDAISYRIVGPGEVIYTIEVFTPNETIRFMTDKTLSNVAALDAAAKSLDFKAPSNP